MHPDPFQLYGDFLKGRPGRCVFTEAAGCHAFASEDEIDATFGSRHDGHHFVWLDARPDLIGFISDDYIDELLTAGRIASTFCEMSGVTAYSRAGLKAAVLLGATRMQKVLDLPAEDGKVSADTIDTLPLWGKISFMRGGETVIAARLTAKQPAILTLRISAQALTILPSDRIVDARSGEMFNIREQPRRSRDDPGLLEMLIEAGVT